MRFNLILIKIRSAVSYEVEPHKTHKIFKGRKTRFALALLAMCVLFMVASKVDAAVSNNGLVGYWSLNDGAGLQATDFSGNRNTGALTNGPTWTNGRSGKALSFDGVNDYVSVPNSTSLIPGTSNWTVVAWVKTSVANTYVYGIRTNANSDSYELGIDSSGKAIFGYDEGHGGINPNAIGATTITDNQWHLIVGTRTGNHNATIYVDGKSDGTDNCPLCSATSINPTTAIAIGARNISGTLSSYFNGLIDDVRVYNRALSATEVKQLYQQGATKINAPPSNSGLVAYWPLNDGAGVKITDHSANGNTGPFCCTPTGILWTNGRLGKGLNFPGVDWINIDDATVLKPAVNLSYGGWFYSTVGSTFQSLFEKGDGSDGGYGIYTTSDNKLCSFIRGTTSGVEGGNTSTLIGAGKWYHVFITVDTSQANGSKLLIYLNGVSETKVAGTNCSLLSTLVGNIAQNTKKLAIAGRGGAIPNGDSSFQGILDEIRIYNRTLSAAEVKKLYVSSATKINPPPSNLGLVGYWSLNDGTAFKATDHSGQGNTGTLVSGPTWTNGRFGKALSFDGVNDYVDAGSASNLDNLTPYTASAWVKVNTSGGTWKNIVVKTASASDQSYFLYIDGGGKFTTWIGRATSAYSAVPTNTLPLGVWKHVVAVGDINGGVLPKLYIDGVEVSSYTTQQVGSGTRVTDAAANLYIGSEQAATTHELNGLIDDVRIYNRALSAGEVKRLYMAGATRQ